MLINISACPLSHIVLHTHTNKLVYTCTHTHIPNKLDGSLCITGFSTCESSSSTNKSTALLLSLLLSLLLLLLVLSVEGAARKKLCACVRYEGIGICMYVRTCVCVCVCVYCVCVYMLIDQQFARDEHISNTVHPLTYIHTQNQHS